MYQFMEKMGVKRHMKVKGGWAAAEAIAATSEGVQKLLTRYEGVTEANSLKKSCYPSGGGGWGG